MYTTFNIQIGSQVSVVRARMSLTNTIGRKSYGPGLIQWCNDLSVNQLCTERRVFSHVVLHYLNHVYQYSLPFIIGNTVLCHLMVQLKETKLRGTNSLYNATRNHHTLHAVW